MNKVKTSDALDYALMVYADLREKAEFTRKLNQEMIDAAAKSIWCRWFKFKPEGLSMWDEGWIDIDLADIWQKHVEMLEYHQSCGHDEVVPPFTSSKGFYHWAKETNRC